MPVAIIRRWVLRSGHEDAFRLAWADAARAIHARCGSYGARLHDGPGGEVWAYARWPSDATRDACLSDPFWSNDDSFDRMEACVAERFPEVRLGVTSDLLFEGKPRHMVPVLTTERLVLRPLAYTDAERLLPALGDGANMRYWSRGPLEDVEAVRSYIGWNVDGPGVQCFAVCHRQRTDEAHGWVVLMDRRAGEGELGFILRPDAQGQGLAREAASRVIAHALEVRGLHRLFADVDPENRASIRLLESLGLRREGHLRATYKTHMGLRDSYIYALLASDR